MSGPGAAQNGRAVQTRGIIRAAAAGGAAGLAAGVLVLGVGGRLAMSVVMLMARARPAWSLDGTFAVVAVGALLGAGAGLAYAALRRFLPGNSLARGLLFGVLLYGVLLLFPPASARTAMAGFVSLHLPILALFGLVSLAYGAAVAAAFEALRRRWPPP